MSESPTTSAKAPDVIQDPEPTVAEDRVFQAPVLVTEQEVMFSTAAAVPMPPTTIIRRLIDAIRHYPQRFSYLDRALMAREMYRL